MLITIWVHGDGIAAIWDRERRDDQFNIIDYFRSYQRGETFFLVETTEAELLSLILIYGSDNVCKR